MTKNEGYKRNILLNFPPELSGKPAVCNLVRLFDLDFAILQARITPRHEGEMTLQLIGSPSACDQGIKYLKERGISVSSLGQRVWHDQDTCMHCGTCTALCPVDAIKIDTESRLLVFNSEKCTACSLCFKICPVKAMQIEPSLEVKLQD